MGKFFHEDLRTVFKPLHVDGSAGCIVEINDLGKPYESLSQYSNMSRKAHTRSSLQWLMKAKYPRYRQGDEGEGYPHSDLSARR